MRLLPDEAVPPVGVATNSLTPSDCPTDFPTDYDASYRLATDATATTYDALGDAVTITTPPPEGQSGHETTSNSFDANGQLLTTTTPPATSSGSPPPSQLTTYGYDDAGELVSVETEGTDSSADSLTSYCYDPDGDRTATVPPDGNTPTPATCSGSPSYNTGSANETEYAYDSLGELVSKQTPSTAAVTNPSWAYTYDPAGNLLTTEDPNTVTTTNTYTPLDQLASIDYSDSTPDVSYGYDANGNRLSMSDGTGDSSYGYDVFDELQSYENGAGNTVSYAYNDDGETTGITYPLGAGATWASTDTVSYGYDDNGQLHTIDDFNGHTITLDNTDDGLPYSETLGASGDTILTTYDPTDTPSEISLCDGAVSGDTCSGTTLQSFSYSDEPSGAIATETDTPSSSLTPADYSYDAQNRVTEMNPGTNASVSYSPSDLTYSFDASGNLTTLPTGLEGCYDNASELVSDLTSGACPGTPTDSYTYDADGERTQEAVGGSTTASASYNGAQELTAYNNAAADMTAASYDGDGLRQSETSTPTGGGSTTQNFVWDPATTVPSLLMDSTNAYIYGPGGTPLEPVNLSTGTIQYLVSDLLGSVRGIVSSAGALTASTAYDAWGNPETTGGLTSYTPFGYAGGYTDPTGLSYLVSRYYDPQVGQFFTVDPVVDETGAPYVYGGDDPVLNDDPSGRCSSSRLLSYATNAVPAGDVFVQIALRPSAALASSLKTGTAPLSASDEEDGKHHPEDICEEHSSYRIGNIVVVVFECVDSETGERYLYAESEIIPNTPPASEHRKSLPWQLRPPGRVPGGLYLGL